VHAGIEMSLTRRAKGRFPLPFDAKADQIQARFTDGVLEVRIPEPAESTPGAIKIPVS
jgi:HSP20 family molecular chaperone IbpA